MLPVLDIRDLTLECINHLARQSKFDIIVIYDNGDHSEVKIDDPKIKFIKNKTAKGLSSLWNMCIRECPTEYVIIASWRPRPLKYHFELMDTKLSEGYAVVALCTMHFFAFSKHLTTIIGWFDEGFKKGQYEDSDYWNRMYVNDLGFYVSDELYEQPQVSMWRDGK
jgi:hypothetical protein